MHRFRVSSPDWSIAPRSSAEPVNARAANSKTQRLRSASAAALLLALIGLVSGCAAVPKAYRATENFPLRLSDLESVTLVPPLVSVVAMSSGNVEQEVQEWSDAANEHAQNAVREIVEGMGKRYVPYAGEHGPRPNFRIRPDDVNRRPQVSEGEQSWLLFESAKESILRHTYDLTQLFPDQMSDFDYALGPEAAALLSGTRADAFLLMIANDAVPTADRAALIGVGAAAALVTGGYGGPGATPAELIVALVESKTGDILYFNRVSMPLADLRDPEANRKLVALALAGFAP